MGLNMKIQLMSFTSANKNRSSAKKKYENWWPFLEVLKRGPRSLPAFSFY